MLLLFIFFNKSIFLLAAEQQHVLAAANEEGIVRIYNTESHKKPLLKGTLLL